MKSMSGNDKQLALTSADHGTTLQVEAGTRLQLELPENPTTGFLWHIQKLPEFLIESNRTYRMEHSLPGAVGRAQWLFQVQSDVSGVPLEQGYSDTLSLALYQEWEPSVVSERYAVTLMLEINPVG